MLKLLAIKSVKINHRGEMNLVADCTHPHSGESRVPTGKLGLTANNSIVLTVRTTLNERLTLRDNDVSTKHALPSLSWTQQSPLWDSVTLRRLLLTLYAHHSTAACNARLYSENGNCLFLLDALPDSINDLTDLRQPESSLGHVASGPEWYKPNN